MIYSSAVVILIKPSGKILMQLRDDGGGKPIDYPNTWCFPGGEIEDDEKPIDAAVREIQEETNIRIEPGSLIQIFTYDHDETSEYIFVGFVPEDTVAKVLEGEAMEWLTFDEIAQLELAFEQAGVLPVLKPYLEDL